MNTMNTMNTNMMQANHPLSYIIYSNESNYAVRFSITISTPEACFTIPCCYVCCEEIIEAVGKFSDKQQNCKIDLLVIDEDTIAQVEITPTGVIFRMGSISWTTNIPTVRTKLISLFRKLAA
jgi:hypothetical protein